MKRDFDSMTDEELASYCRWECFQAIALLAVCSVPSVAWIVWVFLR